MTSHSSDPPAPPAAEAFGQEPRRARWSWGHRVFVFALTLALCFAVLVLVAAEKVKSLAPLCIPSDRKLTSRARGVRAQRRRPGRPGGTAKPKVNMLELSSEMGWYSPKVEVTP